MNKSKLIWMTMYKRLRKPHQIKRTNSACAQAIKNHIEYCAKREGVIFNESSFDKNSNNTKTQEKLIRDILKNYPQYKETDEFKVYENNKTAINAYDFISFVYEQSYIQSNERLYDRLFKYVENVPIDLDDEKHGLFSYYNNIDLKKVENTLSRHTGVIWIHVLSLRREDAQRLGFTTQKAWKDLISENVQILADAHNIKTHNLRWYAALHDKAHHPHVHLIVYSKDPNEGLFSQKYYNSVYRCKLRFEHEIFKDDIDDKDTLLTAVNDLQKLNDDIKLKIQKGTPFLYKQSIKTEYKNFLNKLANHLDDDSINYDSFNSLLKKYANKLEKILIYGLQDFAYLYELTQKCLAEMSDIDYLTMRETPIDQNSKFDIIKNTIITSAVYLRDTFHKTEYLRPDKTLGQLKDEYTYTKDPSILYSIAQMYNYGINCNCDYDVAKFYYKKANENGFEKARYDIENVEKQQENLTLSISNCINHFTRIIDTDCQNMQNQILYTDKKLGIEIKKTKISHGQSKEDSSTMSFDY